MDKRISEIVGLAKSLISFKTTSDNVLELSRIIDFVEDYFRGSSVVIEKHVINKKPSIIVLFEKTKKPELFLNAHLDVVPAPENEFNPAIKSGKLYGRGAIDDKLPAAILIYLMKESSKQKKKPSIGLMLTSDEEVGGENGVKKLLEAYSCSFAVIPDGGDMCIITKMKGVLQVRLSATGKSAHGSQPWLGKNAIEKLMKSYFEIKKLFPETTPKNRWLTTINPAVIKAGDAINKVPDYAELYIDIRHPETESKEKILRKLESVKGIKVDVLIKEGFMIADKNNAYLQKFKKAAEKILKTEIEFGELHGTTDARYFSEKKIPAVIFRPIGKGEHANEEYAEISSIRPFYDVLCEFIDKNVRKISK